MQTTMPTNGSTASFAACGKLGLTTMSIKKIVILPPLAFARFGSHPDPVASYTLEPPQENEPLGYRQIKPEPTLIVSATGEIERIDSEPDIRFKEKFKDDDGNMVHQVHPVAPFFELWAEYSDGTFVHLTRRYAGWRAGRVVRRGRQSQSVSAHPITSRCRHGLDPVVLKSRASRSAGHLPQLHRR